MPQSRNAVLKVISPSGRPRGGKSTKEAAVVAQFPVTPIRVYVLRCDPLRAAGLEALFEENSGIEIHVESQPGEVGTGWLDPAVGVVVIGTQLGGGTMKLIASIRSARPDVNILLMSPAAGDEVVLNVLSLGGKGFLHESCTPEQFEEAIRAVAGGNIWAPRRLQAQLIERLLASRDPRQSPAAASFTQREQQVLNLLLDGRSNREIGNLLQIEERTVKSYVAKLMAKTGVKNRTALSMQAFSVRTPGT